MDLTETVARIIDASLGDILTDGDHPLFDDLEDAPKEALRLAAKNAIDAVTAHVLCDQGNYPDDEDVWLQAWIASVKTGNLLTRTQITTLTTNGKGSVTNNEYTDGAIWRADGCLAAFRKRFRNADAMITAGDDAEPNTSTGGQP